MLSVVAEEFGADWVNTVDDNPVRKLWQRRDWLASAELLTLGEAIQNLLAADPGWTRRQIKKMKSLDPGTRSGATFEIIGLNLFHGPHTLVPAPGNNPGYDGRVVLKDGSSLILSIKNHGISSGETEFRRRAASVKHVFCQALQRRSMNGVRQRIITTSHPGANDWKRLEGQMDTILSGNISPDAIAPWSGLIEPIDAKYQPLSANHLSYALMLAAPSYRRILVTDWVRRQRFELAI